VSGARERIREAMLDFVYSQGYEATSVEQILEQAEASRKEFDRLYRSKEALAIEIFDDCLADYEGAVRKAYEAKAQWPDSLRAAAYAVADWIVEHPRETRFGLVEMLWASEVTQARREESIQRIVDIFDAGRQRAKDPESIPPFTAEGVLGSIAEILTKRLQRGDLEPYELVPEMMYVAVLPFMGPEAATKELTMPRPPAAGRGRRGRISSKRGEARVRRGY
jgi:AcrR family transcriptional regulator